MRYRIREHPKGVFTVERRSNSLFWFFLEGWYTLTDETRFFEKTFLLQWEAEEFVARDRRLQAQEKLRLKHERFAAKTNRIVWREGN